MYMLTFHHNNFLKLLRFVTDDNKILKNVSQADIGRGLND